MISADDLDVLITQWRGQNMDGRKPYMSAAADIAEKILTGELANHAEIPSDIVLSTSVRGYAMLRARTMLVNHKVARRAGSKVYVVWEGAA